MFPINCMKKCSHLFRRFSKLESDHNDHTFISSHEEIVVSLGPSAKRFLGVHVGESRQ